MAFDKAIKRRSKTVRLRQNLARYVITPAILMTILISSTRVGAIAFESGLGTISLVGTVHVNGEVAKSGQTLFVSSKIETSPHSESLVDFKNLVHLRLASESALTVDAAGAQLLGTISVGHLH